MNGPAHDELDAEVSRLRTRLSELEERLQRSETIRGQLLENSPLAVILWDTQCKVQQWNPAAERIFGFPRDEVRDQDAIELLMPPEYREQARQSFREILGGRGVEHVLESVTRDGRRIVCQWHCLPLRDVQGQVVGVVSLVQDITERKQSERALQEARDELERKVAERTRDVRTANRILREDITKLEQLDRELRASEQRFRVIAEAMPIPVAISRFEDGVILYVNPRVTEAFGVSPEELVGRQAADFYADPSQREPLRQRLRSQGQVRDHELQARRPDGSSLWISVSLQPISYQGEPCVLAGLIDITQRKQAEQQLREERRRLKRLLDLHDRDRQLIAFEIHDGIVQDMTGALMFLEAVSQEVREQTGAAHENLVTGMRLIQESITEARRLINGLRPPVLEEAGLVPAIEHLVDDIRTTSGISIQFTHQVRFVRIAPAIEMAVYRIVQEALNNVWRHSESERAEVKLVQQDHEVEIDVRDWGIGFDISHVGKRRYGLRGIRERARLLGGQAQIESTPGQGTRVRVVLPLEDVLLPAEMPDIAEENGV